MLGPIFSLLFSCVTDKPVDTGPGTSPLYFISKLNLPAVSKESTEAACETTTTPPVPAGYQTDGDTFTTDQDCVSSITAEDPVISHPEYVYSSTMDTEGSSIYFTVGKGTEVVINQKMTLGSLSLFCTDDLTNPLAFIGEGEIDPLACKKNDEDNGYDSRYRCSPIELSALHGCGTDITQDDTIQLTLDHFNAF